MPARSDAAPALSSVQAWTVTLTATLVMTVSYIDRQTLSVIAPTVRDALGINHAEYGWLTAAFSLAYLAFAPVSGALVDRLGCRVGLVLAVLLWSAVSGLHALSASFASLFALRIALGVAESPSFPAAAQAVRRALPPARRSTGFGLLFTGSSVGAIIAAPLAIGILKQGSWRLAFLGTSAVGLAWIPLWLWASGSRQARAALDVGGAAAAASEPEAPSDEAWHRLLREPAVLRAMVLVLACAPALSFILNWLPQYLVAERMATQASIAGYVWLPLLCFDLGSVGFGALASRFERTAAGVPVHTSHRGLVAIAGLACASMTLMPLARDVWPTVAIASLAAAGGGGLYALLTADMLGRVSPSRVSMTGGLTAAAQSLAYVAASPLIGVSVDRTGNFRLALVALGATVLPGAVAWIAWPVRAPRRS
jgi:ACS family hexuronate transporter-like MFS transporter